ncbi:DNA helicase RecQ [Luteolibacter sp. GHJ8]|uniref:DNA helicase RecQ n=1 Tax=Luteolibacter rhizosphaerae TaxID=2989719 RepID=A0ABT3G0K0_9BACT|nr:DNA helicase RecQ [Luteolibacter rhizosphaerae]MCW1913372.1 DNA helicase RecQ [Luteolibacter rhizosphaerae]
MTMVTDLSRLLKRHFGYDAFRPLQREIMEAALVRRDVLAILPTGAGKSLCYQLPALARQGVTLVVSPLIALMKDQVDQLTAAGVAATFLNSTLDPQENRQRLEAIRGGGFKLVYLAPERLLSRDFLSEIRRWNVTALAVDEAHCISEWGHDFRPEYRRLRELRQALPDLPAIALTATATPRVREDILTQLSLREPAVFLASFNRPNLNYLVEPKQDATARIVGFIRERGRDSGIVYAQSRKRSEELAASLRGAGIPAVCYHAGLETAERARNQEAFLRDEIRVVCATVAFGMGINKPDVRFVIHADLPKNLEGYYQETGRAGRDGLPADCMLLFSRGDVVKQQRFLGEITDEDARETARFQLEHMADFAESDACRRTGLLGYFGETWAVDNCGACDNCLAPRESWDATVETQKLLSCAIRVKQAGGSPVGIRHLADILAGSRAEKLLARNHDKLSTYGIGKEHSAAKWAEVARQLVHKGWFAVEGGNYPVVSITTEGNAVLRERQAVSLTRLMTVEKPSARRAGDIECDAELFEALRAHRKQVADAAGVPPYVVFSDVSLRHMAREYPGDDASFLRIPGVGERKLSDHGNGFLREISAWLENHERREFAPLPVHEIPGVKFPKPVLNGTAYATLELWRAGKSVEEIAAKRGFAASTIEGHLVSAIEAGEDIDPRRIYSTGEEQEIRAALDGYDDPSLKPVFEHLGGRISYGKLKLFRAIEIRRASLQPA